MASHCLLLSPYLRLVFSSKGRRCPLRVSRPGTYDFQWAAQRQLTENRKLELRDDPIVISWLRVQKRH